MSRLRFTEVSTPSTPSANDGTVFLDSSTGMLSIVKDSGSVHILEGVAATVTALPAAPSHVQFIQVKSAGGVAGILYVSLQNSSDTWVWVPIMQAP